MKNSIQDFSGQLSINASLGDLRRTTIDGDTIWRLHKGIDIANTGDVYSISSGRGFDDGTSGDSKYIRVGNYWYIHLKNTIGNGDSVIGINDADINNILRIDETKSSPSANDSILQTVYSHEYADTILDAIFDTATVSIEQASKKGWNEEYVKNNSKDNKLEIVYPKVLITKDSLKFMDVNGKTKKSIGLKKKARGWNKTVDEIMEWNVEIRISENERYIGLLIPRDVNMLEGMSMGDLVIYNADGEEQWRLDSIFLSDGDIKISPDGEYALGMPPAEAYKRYPYYYNKFGMKKIDEINDKYNKPYVICFSSNAEYFLIVMNKNYYNNRLIKYSKDGEKLKVLENQSISDVEFVNNDKIIIIYKNKNGINNVKLIDSEIDEKARANAELKYLCYDIRYNKNNGGFTLFYTVKTDNDNYEGEYWELSSNLSLQKHILYTGNDRILGILDSQKNLFYGQNGLYMYENREMIKTLNIKNITIKKFESYLILQHNDKVIIGKYIK